jgi:TRAP-type C4-dicarboxylate transport system permease small subunit
LFAGLTIVVALQVLTRFVLHEPFIWSEEAARFLFFWVVMLGATMGVKNRRHFVVDVTMGRTQRMGRIGRFLFDIIPDLCVLGFSIFLLVLGIGYAQSGMLRTATHTDVNMGLVYLAIPVFAALSVLYSASSLLRDTAAFVEGRGATPLPPPGAE